MYWRAVIASMFLMGASVASTAHASEVTTYGAGLKSCVAYLDARQQQNTDEVAFVEWLSGYASGVNSTSNHTNNILGDANLKEAVYRLMEPGLSPARCICTAESRAMRTRLLS